MFITKYLCRFLPSYFAANVIGDIFKSHYTEPWTSWKKVSEINRCGSQSSLYVYVCVCVCVYIYIYIYILVFNLITNCNWFWYSSNLFYFIIEKIYYFST